MRISRILFVTLICFFLPVSLSFAAESGANKTEENKKIDHIVDAMAKDEAAAIIGSAEENKKNGEKDVDSVLMDLLRSKKPAGGGGGAVSSAPRRPVEEAPAPFPSRRTPGRVIVSGTGNK